MKISSVCFDVKSMCFTYVIQEKTCMLETKGSELRLLLVED